MLLWNPIWNTPPHFKVWRGRLKAWAVGWQDGEFVTIGNPLVIKEFPFGGYRLHIKFKDLFWEPNHKFWDLEGIFEDVYAMPPFSIEKVSCGDVIVEVKQTDLARGLTLLLALPTLSEHYYFTEVPPVPNTYWRKNTLPWQRTPPFIYVP